jgi:hypothetical protein
MKGKKHLMLLTLKLRSGSRDRETYTYYEAKQAEQEGVNSSSCQVEGTAYHKKHRQAMTRGNNTTLEKLQGKDEVD